MSEKEKKARKKARADARNPAKKFQASIKKIVAEAAPRLGRRAILKAKQGESPRVGGDDLSEHNAKKHGLFTKGGPGGPGRPKGCVSLIGIMKRVLAESDGRHANMTRGEVMVRKAYQFMLDGTDFRYYKEFLDRIEGKVPDRLITDVAREAVVTQVALITSAFSKAAIDAAGKVMNDEQLKGFTESLLKSIDEIEKEHAIPDLQAERDRLIAQDEESEDHHDAEEN